jgi:hypothetical protein
VSLTVLRRAEIRFKFNEGYTSGIKKTAMMEEFE